MTDEAPLPAGRFSEWLDRSVHAQEDRTAGIDVPCGSCTACCRSSYFVHIEPDEAETLRRIPPALLFPAPGLPKGHVVLGYDERGHCPMLVDDGCSIYEDRPRTCRTYDCRVFAAAGLSPDDDGKPEVADRVRRWTFDVTTTDDVTRRAAVRAAAAFLADRSEDCFPAGNPPPTSGDLAALAVRVHRAFLTPDVASGRERLCQPDIDAVRALLRR